VASLVRVSTIGTQCVIGIGTLKFHEFEFTNKSSKT